MRATKFAQQIIRTIRAIRVRYKGTLSLSPRLCVLKELEP